MWKTNIRFHMKHSETHFKILFARTRLLHYLISFTWIVGCIEVYRHFNSWGHIMAVGEAAWLSHTSTNTTFFPKPSITSSKCSSRGERRKKVRLNLNYLQVMSPTRSPLGHPGRAGSHGRALRTTSCWIHSSIPYCGFYLHTWKKYKGNYRTYITF